MRKQLIGLKLRKKMVYNLNYFSDDQQSERLANIDPRLFDKSNVEKQLDDSEMARQFRDASHTSRIARKYISAKFARTDIRAG